MAVHFVFAVFLATAVVALPSSKQNSATASNESNLYTALKDGNKACLEDKSYIVCIGVCTIFNTLGILDKDGQYVESKMVEYVATARGLNQEETMQTAKTCGTVNGTTETGCERARKVFQCLSDKNLKEPNYHEIIFIICKPAMHRQIFIFPLYDAMHGFQEFWNYTDGRYVESKLVEYMATAEKLNQEQVNQTAKACNSVNGTTETGCETARRVLKCITDQRFKINGEQIKL